MVLLVYELERPVDWTYAWPPRLTDIGKYIGLTFDGRTLSESTIRYRQQALEDMWRGKRGPLRQNYLKIDLQEITIAPDPPKPAEKRRKGMTDAEYNARLKRYALAIRKLARKYGKTDNDLVEDLEQVGRITLWELDLSTVKTNEDAFVRQAIKFRMIDFLRTIKDTRTESLEKRVGSGDQITQDDTGRQRIIPSAARNQWVQPKGERWGWTEDPEEA